jgi:GNAT superfamily N-acetyltransferase
MYVFPMPGASSDRDGSTEMFTIRPALPSEIDVLKDIDADAGALYAEYGLSSELELDHVFARAELARWLRSAELGRAFLAVDETGTGVGFAALDVVDDEPYLDQLAVRVAAMRRGIGRRLLARSTDWARATGGSAIWLTTYDHVPFNRPYYERHGYFVMPEDACGPSILHHIREQQRYLPAPAHRVAMRRLV